MIPLLAVAGLGVTALVSASIAALHAGRVVVPRVASWPAPPGVWISDELEDLYPAILAAVRRWEDLGHDFGPLQLGGRRPPPEGWVQVERGTTPALATADLTGSWDDSEDPSVQARDAEHVTRTIDVLPSGIILRARIRIDPIDVTQGIAEYVLAHELGHALGYLHEGTALLGRTRDDRPRLGLVGRKTGHLMHPVRTSGGWDTEGLEAGALDEHLPQRLRRRRKVKS